MQVGIRETEEIYIWFYGQQSEGSWSVMPTIPESTLLKCDPKHKLTSERQKKFTFDSMDKTGYGQCHTWTVTSQPCQTSYMIRQCWLWLITLLGQMIEDYFLSL